MKLNVIYIVVIIALSVVATKAFDHISSIKFPETVSFQIKDGDKTVPLINLSPEGILTVDIPRFAKIAEQNKLDAAKAAKAQKK